ncbi:NAD(P)/FAD-dependent oxidoreductase [Oceanobacillus halophilus]|uniref:FAD-binding oxidoreductase n=1 Tax=Oceanobacillus halophilus TaxID=930130 RepID=A0A495A3A3_9BACI|nr:FAD-dependent oxidoreductase [Oceanobacillus halophilus]RKQ33938.1 FAD-binding oxidoreductase [Oceanobacillus halophilus]
MKIVIIGSGIVGASAAYRLAKDNHEVIMIDNIQEGKATAAGAGIVCPWVSRVEDKDWYKIARNGAKFYPSLIEELKKDGENEVGYKKVGALCVSSNKMELDEIEKKIKIKQPNAPELGDISRYNSEQTRALFPPISEKYESVFVSGAARVDGRLLTDAMKRAAQKHGAKLIQGDGKLVFEEGKVTGVTVHTDTYQADYVLVAAGAWSPALLEPLGLQLKVEPQRGQIAHIKLPEKDTSTWPVVLPQSSYYMLAFDDSRIVAGATRETGSGYDYRMTAGGVNEVLTEALEIAPDLSSGTLEEVRIGFRPMSSDGLPLLGKLDYVDGLVLATGLGASGLTMGPYVGKLAASIMTRDEIDVDLDVYNPMRSISKIEKV